MFGWWQEADPAARRALAAGLLGWMLDAFDVMLFALVLPYLSADLGMTKRSEEHTSELQSRFEPRMPSSA